MTRTRLGALAASAAALVAVGCASAPHVETRDEPAGIRFRLRAPGAARVAVVGDFNGWDPGRHPMADPDGDGVFETFVPTAARRVEYQFWVDGARRPDPAASITVGDGFGGENSLLLRR